MTFSLQRFYICRGCVGNWSWSGGECGNVAGDVTCRSLVERGICDSDELSTATVTFIRERCALACRFCATSTAPTAAAPAAHYTPPISTSTPATTTTTTATTTTNNDDSPPDSGIPHTNYDTIRDAVLACAQKLT